MRLSIFLQISVSTTAFIACQDAQVSQARHDNCQGCSLCRWPLLPSCLWAWSIYWQLSWTDGTGRGGSKLVPKVSHWFSPIMFIHCLWVVIQMHSASRGSWQRWIPIPFQEAHRTYLGRVWIGATLEWVWSCWRHCGKCAHHHLAF